MSLVTSFYLAKEFAFALTHDGGKGFERLQQSLLSDSVDLNRQDGGQRMNILIERGDRFDTVLTRRVRKVVYSTEWRDGKAVASFDA